MKESSPAANQLTPVASTACMTTEQAEVFLRCLGQAVSNMSIYGPQHKATRQALDESFTALEKILTTQEVVLLGVTDDHLHCSGQRVEAKTALLRTLVRRLNITNVGMFGLKRGMRREEFERVMRLIGTAARDASAQGGVLATAIQSGEITHLSVKKISYQAIAEDELVVHKEAITQLALQAVDSQAEAASAASAEILAFLQGQADTGSGAVSKAAEDLAAQPAKLAELLLRAADIRPETANLADGESLGNMVVGCLRRLHHKFSTAPSGKTQQGKKSLSRTLVLLEEDVVERLRAMSGAVAADAAAAIIGKEVNGLVADLRLEALAEDYLKKRRLSDATEQQLIKFIAARKDQPERADSLHELEKKLTGGGLDRSGWEHLLLKGGGVAGTSKAETSSLPLLLMRLTELLDPAKHPVATGAAQAQMGAIVSELKRGVTSAVAGMEQKVGVLRAEMQEVRPLSAKAQPHDVELQARSRRQIITTLAEIVQELRQPLSVINGSIEMLCAGHLGLVPDLQREMLNLALQSGRRLSSIVDTLSIISGMPASLQLDAQVLECIYHP